MNRSDRKLPFVAILFILIGAAAMRFAFWLLDHREEMPNSEIMLAVSVGIFFVLSTGAFLLFLRWRDSRRGVFISTASSTSLTKPELAGTVYGLIPGSQYQIKKSFTDYYGNAFERGELLRFKERHFLPYEGGHTILFVERPLYLQEEKNEEILDNFSDYIVQIA
jgi:hypothetical protein